MVKEIETPEHTIFKMCSSHPKQFNKFFCVDSQVNICNLCVDKYPKQELKTLKIAIAEYVTPWKRLLNDLNRCLTNLKPESDAKIKENLKRA